jgi:transposase
MRPYGLDLRTKILEAYERGEGSVRTLARLFGVTPNTVQNYRTRVRVTGRLEPDPHAGGVPPRIDDAHREEVRALVAEKPDATVAELAKLFARRARIRVSRPTMGRVLQALGLTRKKKRFMRTSATPSGSSLRALGSRDASGTSVVMRSFFSTSLGSTWA